MRTCLYLRAALVAAAALGGFAGSISFDSGAAGISPAAAREVYTRKRVNGRWITGRFVKRNGPSARVSRAALRPSRALAMRSAAPEREAVPLPAPRPRLAEAQVAEVGPAPLVPLSGDDRLLLLQKALQARAKNLVATTLAGPEGTPADGAGPMVTGALGGTRPSAARPEAHSVSFDFKSGVKTIVFADGAVVREPFDVPSLKGLAATETGARPGSAP